jgi:hypothetical protein
MYQVLEAHNGFILRRNHAWHTPSFLRHEEQSKGLLICVCFSTDFHERYTMSNILRVYQPNHHKHTMSNFGAYNHDFGILSFGGPIMSLVHYILGAATKTLVY